MSTARDGAEALSLLRDRSHALPQLILLDLMMPVLDGWAVGGALAADPELAEIPVVVLSGAADIQLGSFGKGSRTMLVKPVDWRQLVGSVTSVVGAAPAQS